MHSCALMLNKTHSEYSKLVCDMRGQRLTSNGKTYLVSFKFVENEIVDDEPFPLPSLGL